MKKFAAVLLLLGSFALSVRAATSTITNPVPGTVIGTSSPTFMWTNVPGFTSYGLQIGTTGVGSTDVLDFDFGIQTNFYVATGIPTNTAVYVRLWVWTGFGQATDFIFNDDLDDDGIRNPFDAAPNVADAKTVRAGTNYTLTVLGSARVASLLVDAATFDSATSSIPTATRYAVSKMVYEQFKDDFDVLFFTQNQENAPNGSASTQMDAKNTVQGIGKGLFNNSSLYGSAGKLESTVHLNALTGMRNGPSLHEFFHHWGNSLAQFPTTYGSHWGASSVKGVLGGFDSNSLVDLGGGSWQVAPFSEFTGAGNTTPFAPLELYLMGLIPAADVPDTKIAINFANYSQNTATTATFTATSISNKTSAQIVVDNGARIPDSTNSQKSFKGLHVVLTKTPLANPLWARMDEDTHRFSRASASGTAPLLNFWEATGGRATLELTNLFPSLKSATTSLVTLVANPTNGGAVLGGGIYLSGTSITITAVGNIGWVFNNWNDANTNASRVIIVPESNITYTANFSVLAGPSPNIVTGATVLLVESCLPTNGAVDPVETVTVNFELRNAGSGETTNIIATLLTNGGVVNVSGPQSYGALAPAGTNVSRSFTFAALGTCGGKITNHFQITDGATSLGTVSFVLSVGAGGISFAENFDAVTAPALPAGWTTSSSGSQPNWETTATTPDTAPNAAFSPNSSATGVNELVTAPFAVSSASAMLSFRHKYGLEVDDLIAYDGGVLEIKIGAGSFADILAAGGIFVTNGYTHTLDTDFFNPLSGRPAWSGSSAYKTTVVILPAAAAGQLVQLRWRCGTDSSTGDLGWWIDGIEVTDLACCTPPQPNIVRLLQGSGANVTVHSTGHGAIPPTAEYTTNLIAPQNWQPALATNTWANGTNTTTFTAPPGANPAFIRVKQAGP